MSRTTHHLLIGAMALVLLAGCGMDRPLIPDHGQAVRQNMAAQIANPDAVAATGPVVSDAARAAVALDSLLKGAPAELAPVSTTNVE